MSEALPLDDLLPFATEWARTQAPKAGRTLQTIRTMMYREAIDLLAQPVALDLPG